VCKSTVPYKLLIVSGLKLLKPEVLGLGAGQPIRPITRAEERSSRIRLEGSSPIKNRASINSHREYYAC